LILGKIDKLSKKVKKSNLVDEDWQYIFYNHWLKLEYQAELEKLLLTKL
jgi:hypothetical protein